MSQKATGALTKTALEVVRAQLDRVTDYVIDYNQITLTVNPLTSEFVLTAREVTGDGSANNFVGEVRRPYEKLELPVLLPEALFIDLAYPVSFNMLRLHLKETYDIVIEEQEFAKASDPLVGLRYGDYLDVPLERTLGMVELVTTIHSGRFVPGARLSLLFAYAGTQRRLNDVYRQTKTPKVSDLKTSLNSTAGVSLFNASALDLATEFFRRHHGVELDTSQIDALSFPVDHERVRVLLQPKYDVNSPWLGATELLYDKVDIASVTPDYLQINLPYPTTFQALRSFLLVSYGLSIEDGEVSAGSFNNPALWGDDAIDVPLQGHAFLDLYVQRHSFKWKGRSRLRVQFLQFPGNTVGPKITSSAPDGEEGVAWAYQTVVAGGVAPYSYQVFGVAPATLNGATGLYNGSVTEGFYLWRTIVRDANGLIGVKTETAVIGPPVSTGPIYGMIPSDRPGYFVSSANHKPFFASASEPEPEDP